MRPRKARKPRRWAVEWFSGGRAVGLIGVVAAARLQDDGFLAGHQPLRAARRGLEGFAGHRHRVQIGFQHGREPQFHIGGANITTSAAMNWCTNSPSRLASMAAQRARKDRPMYEVPPTRPSRPNLSPLQSCFVICFLLGCAGFALLVLASLFV